MKWRKCGVTAPSSSLKMLLAAGAVQDALVDVHRAARLGLHRLGHEGGEDAVAQRGFPHRALEQEHPVGQVHGVAVGEVDLHLAGAGLVDQGLDAQPVHLAEARELQEEGVEVVDGVNGVRLAARLGLAGTAQRRLQRLVRVLVAGDQVELHLGRHHRLPALRFIQGQHPPQHAARRQRHRRSVEFLAVVDDHRDLLGRPGHDARGRKVGHADHVRVGVADELGVVGLLAVDGVEQHALGQAHLPGAEEQVLREDLAARNPGHVGNHAFDLVDAVFGQEAADVGGSAHRCI
jgi:hypothetical protein